MSDGIVGILATAVRDVNNTRYAELASSSIIVYDYLLTLDQEIRYIWKARWTIGKVLFLLNRYYTLFVVAIILPSFDGFCVHWFRWQGWTGLIAAALAETILLLRLYALYYGSKKVLALMLGFFIAAMTASAVIMGTVLREIEASSDLIPGMKFCVPQKVSSRLHLFWIPILSCETFLCTLACIRGYKSYRDREIRRLGNLRRRPRSYSQPDAPPNRELNILEVLLRDSVGYFVVIFATYLTTTIMWITGGVNVLEIPLGFTVALSSVIANRLLLNLRGSRKNSSSNIRNQNMSSQTVNAVGSMAHTTSLVGVTTTVEDEQGREVNGYELEVLRSLKASS